MSSFSTIFQWNKLDWKIKLSESWICLKWFEINFVSSSPRNRKEWMDCKKARTTSRENDDSIFGLWKWKECAWFSFLINPDWSMNDGEDFVDCFDFDKFCDADEPPSVSFFVSLQSKLYRPKRRGGFASHFAIQRVQSVASLSVENRSPSPALLGFAGRSQVVARWDAAIAFVTIVDLPTLPWKLSKVKSRTSTTLRSIVNTPSRTPSSKNSSIKKFTKNIYTSSPRAALRKRDRHASRDHRAVPLRVLVCFSCHHEAHASCKQVKLWQKKCNDDLETGHWLGANTKDCHYARFLWKKTADVITWRVVSADTSGAGCVWSPGKDIGLCMYQVRKSPKKKKQSTNKSKWSAKRNGTP